MASKKTRKCETCGAIVLDDEIIERNGKYQCMDCAYPLKCYKCESQIKHADRIPLLDGHFCENCLFPDELNIKYSDFLKDYETYKATTKKAMRKATLFRILGYLIGAAIYSFVIQFREDPLYLSYSTQDIAAQSTLAGITTILLIIAIFIPIHLILKKFFPKPELLSETDYYVENYREKYKIDLKKHKDYKNTVQNHDDKSVISENETSAQETEDINELEDSTVELISNENHGNSDDNNSVEEKIKRQKEIIKALKKKKRKEKTHGGKTKFALITSISLSVVFMITTVVLSCLYASKNAELNNYVEELNHTIELKDDKIDGLTQLVIKKNKRLDEIEEAYEFYNESAVCVSGDSNTYHKYECEYFDSSSFYIFNTENAKYQGYKPCKHCCK